jgi:hypothetical protein
VVVVKHACTGLLLRNAGKLREFAATGPEGDSSEDGCELMEFIAQSKQAPVPTYFVGSFGAAAC